MAKKTNDNLIYAIVPKETLWLTNFMISTLFKTTVLATAIAVRVPTSIILAMARRVQRNRATW